MRPAEQRLIDKHDAEGGPNQTISSTICADQPIQSVRVPKS